ncbi:MAG: methyltransferase domain-containing protein [Candidatus Methanoperedens sp.]
MILLAFISPDKKLKNIDDKRKQGERIFWSKIAKIYDRWIESAFRDQYDVFRAKISSYIQPGDAVLEVGTGTGDIAFHIAPIARKVVGIDISPEMITVASRKCSELNLKNLTFQVEDAYRLPFAESYFTKVVSCNSLQTMKEPFKAIIEGKRVLKEGGEFICITYCFGDSGFLEQLKLIKWIILYGKPKYWLNFTSNGLIACFEKAGFEIIRKEVVWKKPVALFLRCRKVMAD